MHPISGGSLENSFHPTPWSIRINSRKLTYCSYPKGSYLRTKLHRICHAAPSSLPRHPTPASRHATCHSLWLPCCCASLQQSFLAASLEIVSKLCQGKTRWGAQREGGKQKRWWGRDRTTWSSDQKTHCINHPYQNECTDWPLPASNVQSIICGYGEDTFLDTKGWLIHRNKQTCENWYKKKKPSDKYNNERKCYSTRTVL